MPQNLVDTPPDWQDEIVVPAPGEPAAVANDPGKPHSLFHALAALAKRTRWLRGLLESHNHDGVYASLAHNHDDRYYTKTEIDTRRTTWAAYKAGAPSPPNGVSVQFTAPASGSYLLEGRAVWQHWGAIHWRREFKVDGDSIYVDTRLIDAVSDGVDLAGSWADQTVISLAAGVHTVSYIITAQVIWGGAPFLGHSMVKVTML